jgi:ABC-2 type transport system ATP-binding protein
MQSAIRVQKLVKRFRSVEAISGLDIDVPANSIYALVGSNGAGKTTTIKVLMNILRPTSGHAEILGRPSTTLAGNALADIGYVSENQEMPDWMTVGSMLSYLRPFYPAWDRQLESHLIQRFNLPVERKLKNLSRGMRMKVALASSLAYRPKLLVLDEPFTGLDPIVRDELAQSMAASSEQTTVFVSTHDLAEIDGIATHVGFLENGRLLFSERLPALLDRFREVDVVLESPMTQPASWPAEWRSVVVSDGRIRFVDSAFDASDAAQRIGAVLGHVREISFTSMTLRSIFLAVARTKSNSDPRSNA